MESKQKLKPRCPDWHSKEKERQIKERDALEEKKKSKYLYRGLEESDESESYNELNEVLEQVKKESETGILEILKWLKTNFQSALQQRQLGDKSNYNFSPENDDWEEILIGEPMTKFLKILEVEKSSEKLSIPQKIFDFGLKYKLSLIQDLIDEIVVNSPKFIVCQICKIKFNSLPLHLNKSKDCKGKYTESDLEDLKHAQEVWKKLRSAERYQNEKEEKAAMYQKKKEEFAQRYQSKKDEVTKKMQDYYKKNKISFGTKNAKYYAKNREEILKKRAEHYKTNKAKKE